MATYKFLGEWIRCQSPNGTSKNVTKVVKKTSPYNDMNSSQVPAFAFVYID
jgi:hypothetical protein